MKKKIMPIFIIVSILLLASLQTVFALSSWTDAKIYNVNNKSNSFEPATADGSWLGQDKTSDSDKFQEFTVTRSMWSRPEFKLVNSNGESRSDSVNTAKDWTYVQGNGNMGEIGKAYYGAVKPDWSQTSPGTIKLQHKVF